MARSERLKSMRAEAAIKTVRKRIRRNPSQAKPSQAKVLTGGGDLREAQVDVPLSVSHSCV